MTMTVMEMTMPVTMSAMVPAVTGVADMTDMTTVAAAAMTSAAMTSAAVTTAAVTTAAVTTATSRICGCVAHAYHQA
jgi:hypothetical protein